MRQYRSCGHLRQPLANRLKFRPPRSTPLFNTAVKTLAVIPRRLQKAKVVESLIAQFHRLRTFILRPIQVACPLDSPFTTLQNPKIASESGHSVLGPEALSREFRNRVLAERVWLGFTGWIGLNPRWRRAKNRLLPIVIPILSSDSTEHRLYKTGKHRRYFIYYQII